MKNLLNRTVLVLTICALASLTAVAATTTRKVSFDGIVIVNGTPVTAGNYKATFNDKTGEFTILDGKKVVAKATARLEKLKGVFLNRYATKTNGAGSDLVSINMNSNIRAVIINDSDSKEVKTP
jgi:hypothetical protein